MPSNQSTAPNITCSVSLRPSSSVDSVSSPVLNSYVNKRIFSYSCHVTTVSLFKSQIASAKAGVAKENKFVFTFCLFIPVKTATEEMITSESGNQYLKPDYLSPLPSSLDSKQSPLALLAQTCSQIGADSSPPPARNTTSAAPAAKKTSPKPAFKPYELDEKRKSPRESPTRTSPKYPQDYLKALYAPRACRDPYCHGCPAGLAQLAALAQPYVCSWVSGDSFCGKRFAAPEELLAHLRSHTGANTDPRAAAAANAAAAAASLYPRYHPYPRLFPYLPPYYPPYLYPSRLPPL